MKRISIYFLCLIMIVSCFCACAGSTDAPVYSDDDSDKPAVGKIFYVSPDGDDSADGSENTPFATWNGAKEAVRSLKASEGLPDGGVAVYFRSGTYLVNSSLDFTEEDAGESDKPILYAAAPGAEVLFSGGITLNGADFKPAAEQIKSRLLDPVAAEHLMEIDLEAAGCFDLADKEYSPEWNCFEYRQELYVDNRRQTVARWPNTGYAVCTSSAYDEETGDAYFPIPEEKVRMLADLPSFRFFGAPIFDWATVMIPMTSENVDPGRSSIALRKLGEPLRFEASGFLFNVLPELDVPGEYYWDVEERKLYYYPEGDLADRKVVFSQYASYWFLLNNTSHLEFRNITFENARASVFTFGEEPSSNIGIIGCTFRCLGADAINLNGNRITISDNEIYEIGSGGITVYGGTQDGMRLSDTVITNNRIFDYAQTYTVYNAGIKLGGIGFEVSHNEICNAPHIAILFNSGSTRIEYNYIHNVCSETSDAGAIGSGRRWDWGGNEIRYNYIKDIVDTTLGGTPNGIYLDDCLSDQTCYGNILENIGGDAFALGGGKYLNICNNILIGCNGGLSYDDRGTSWLGDHVAYKSGSMWANLIASGYLDPLHRYYFPKNLLLVEKAEASKISNPDDPGTPSYSNISRNVSVGAETGFLKWDLVEGTAVGNYTYTSIDDIGFEDAEHGNYNLREDAPVFRDVLGFAAIPFDEIGLLD